jgi:N-acyl-D-amino-acid deacylase
MLLVRNGLLLDGTGAPATAGSVLISHGRIVAAGHIDAPEDADVIDVHGLAIAPGFIDMHSHSDLKVLENRTEKSNQGITTEVVGNCGFSPYPCGNHSALLAEQNEGILNGGSSWTNAGAYLAEVRRSSRLVQVESLIGHGALRTAVYGADAASPTLTHLAQMESLLDEALAQGAIGFSTGLMYAPGSEAPHAELEALCRVVARRGSLYTTHMRSYSWQLLESLDEQIDLARRTGCRLQISHLQAVGRDNWDKQQLALERIERALAEGIDIGFDCYPYLAGSTVMTQLLPQRALVGGIAGLLRLLDDPAERSNLEHILATETAQAWEDIFISSLHAPANRPLIGQHLADIAVGRCVTPPAAVLDLLREERGRVNIVAFNQSETNLRALLTHPLGSIITDGFYVAERPHPRLAGAFPTLLGEFVRRRQWLTLEDAVRRITSAPADRLGLTGRGRIVPGAPAQIVVFDPQTIGTNATFETPEMAPHGIELVINGKLLLPKSSSLLEGAGVLPSGAALPHVRVTYPPTHETIGELCYEC